MFRGIVKMVELSVFCDFPTEYQILMSPMVIRLHSAAILASELALALVSLASVLVADCQICGPVMGALVWFCFALI